MVSVEKAVQAELKKLPAAVRRSSEAAAALSLATSIDLELLNGSAKASLTKTLMDTLDRLRALAPSEKQEDKVDELRTRRALRRAAPSV